MWHDQPKETDGTCDGCGNTCQKYRDQGDHDSCGIDVQSQASCCLIFQRHQVALSDKQACQEKPCHNIRNQCCHIIPGFLGDIGFYDGSHAGHISTAHAVKSAGKSGKQCIYCHTGEDDTKRT